MAQTNVNIRMDEELKRNFERLCDDMGLTVTTAITAFAKAAVRKNRMPFELEGDPFYSEANMAHVRKGIEQAENGEYVTMTLDELRTFLGVTERE